jgi:hypothetical protein
VTPEDREIWGRVSSAFAAAAPPRALEVDLLSYIGLAIGLSHLSGAQDARDAAGMLLCQTGADHDTAAYDPMTDTHIDIRGRQPDEPGDVDWGPLYPT